MMTVWLCNYSELFQMIHAGLHHRCGFSPGGPSSPSSSKEVRSLGDGAGEAVGECGAQRDGGRRFAGLSGLEKQGSRDGASAEQGSSFKAEEEKDRFTQTDGSSGR